MRKVLLVMSLIALSSCGAQKASVSSDNESIKLIKEIVKPLSARGVEVEKIERVNRQFVKGLKTYMVKLYDKRNSRYIYRYIWLSDDNRYFTFQILRANFENGTLKVTPVEPAKKVEPVKVNLGWIGKIEKELEKEKIPYTIGNGKKTVYIVWDVYCPFCYSHFKEILGKKVKELDLTVKMIPLPVHGKSSLKGFVYFTDMAQKSGLKPALEKLFEKGNGNFMKYAKAFSKEVEKNYSRIPEKKRKELESFYKNLLKELLSHNVHSTPTVIYIPPGEKKGYINIGFIPLEDIVKMR